MTAHLEHRVLAPGNQQLSDSDLLIVEQFSKLVSAHLDILAQGPDRSQLLDLATRALNEARTSLETGSEHTPGRLPVSKLKVSEVVKQGWISPHANGHAR